MLIYVQFNQCRQFGGFKQIKRLAMTSKSQLMVQWNLHVTQGISVNHLLYPCFHMEFLRSLCEAFFATWCPTLDGRHVSEKSASKTHWFNLVQLLITSSRFYFQIEKQTLEPQKLASLLPLRCAFFLAISLQFWGPVGQPSQSYLLAFRAFSMYKVVCPCWAAPCIALIQATNLKILKGNCKSTLFLSLGLGHILEPLQASKKLNQESLETAPRFGDRLCLVLVRTTHHPPTFQKNPNDFSLKLENHRLCCVPEDNKNMSNCTDSKM